MNNQIAQITRNGLPESYVGPLYFEKPYLQSLPLYLILVVLLLAIGSYFAFKKRKISMFIPVSMVVISVALVFLYLVPLPLKKMCDFSPVDGPLTNCESINITGWSRFVEIITTKDTRSVIPRQHGIFPTGRVY